MAVKTIARAFNVQPKDVRHALEKGKTIQKGRGEYPALEVEGEQRLIDWITKNAQNHTVVNRTELLHYCGETFGTAITPRWVNSFLFRHKLELSETISRPQENPRLEIQRSFLDTMISYRGEHLPGSLAELVFDLDEVGISEWEDRAPRKVIVPVSMTDQTTHHGVHRNLKHMLVICCVSAAGESLTPFVVSLQVKDKVIETLKIEGFRMGVDMVLEHRQKAYVTATLFQQYITNVLIPFIERLRTNPEFIGKSAILLMDNCFIHMRPEVLATLRDHNVKVITFAPHSTQIFQTLDLYLSGVFKSKIQFKLPFANDSLNLTFIRNVFHALKQTFVPDNIRSAFKLLGLELNITQTPYTLLFREDKLCRSPGFQEIWEADYPLDQLSKKRRKARYGWINQDE
jgi:hypothetical protein